MIRPLLWMSLLAVLAAPAAAQDASLEKQARKLHALAGGDTCEGSSYVPEDDYESWTFSYTPSWSTGDESDREEVTLVRLFCFAGAYNESHAYYLKQEYEGLRPIAFAEPFFDVRYENDDFEGKVESISIEGMTSRMLLVNSFFDPDTLSIESFSKWRGIGDASSSGTWIFRDGGFVLKQFAVDASYDGEMNPEVLVDYPGE
jgi:hypothetical protein